MGDLSICWLLADYCNVFVPEYHGKYAPELGRISCHAVALYLH